jgi:hypothetical protein
VTLSERLERAKRERMVKAGLLPSDAPLKPDADVDVTDASTGFGSNDDIRIEVKSAGLHAVSSADPQPTFSEDAVLADERSGMCPNCRRPGRVDMVDLIGHTVHMSCTTCGTMWRAQRSVVE